MRPSRLLTVFSTLALTVLFSNLSFSFDNPIWGAKQYMGDENTYGRKHRLYGASQPLLDTLFQATAQNHHVLGYSLARQVLLGRIYLENLGGQYAVRDVYCLKHYTNQDFKRGGGVGPDRIPDNTVLNTEHTWPQSRFTGNFPNEMQKSDLHHLFPSDSEMNSRRGNHKFAELNGPTVNIKCPTSRFANTVIGYRFEPPMEHRGNVARALFYFSVRYKIHIDNDEEGFLRKWHYQDPVDANEVEHYRMIVEAQGNRNPFVEKPEIVNEIVDF